MIFAGVCTITMIVLLPETYAPVILLKKKNKLREEDPVGNKSLYAEHDKQDWSFGAVIRRTLFRPFYMLALEPILVMVTIYFSIVYGLLFGRRHSLFPSFVLYISNLGQLFQYLKHSRLFLLKGAASQLPRSASYSSVLE